MKKLLFLFTAILFISCSGDDDNDSKSIIGRWNLSTFLFNQEQEILNSCDIQSYLEITENGTGKYYLFYSDDLEIEPCGLDVIYDLTYSLRGDGKTYTMIFDYGDGDYQTGDVVINNNTLTFTSEYDGNNHIITFIKD